MKSSALNPDATFLGHPRRLAFLAFTEAWERFSFYGMQSLLVLYMVQSLFVAGQFLVSAYGTDLRL